MSDDTRGIDSQEKAAVSGAMTPLERIREKELELAGRVLVAKREADEIVAAARKHAAEIGGEAQAVGGAGAAEHAQAIGDAAEQEVERLHASATAEVDDVWARTDARRDEAIDLVLDAVIQI